MAAQSDEFVIRRAERTQVRLRIALQGSSGGGKTGTSLLLAKGMVAELERRGALPDLPCHIGLLDTERDSAKLYSHLVPFDTIVLQPPYTTQRYLKALHALERAGYSVIIVDQITHEWFGEGGILAQVAANAAKNDFTKWNGPSQDHEAFIDTLLKSPAHLIVTMRSKTAWVLEEYVDDQGRKKSKPKRVGMQAKQREGTEYEFTTVFDLSVESNEARCMKDRTELFQVGHMVSPDATPPVGSRSKGIGVDWGRRFIHWVYTATTPEPEQDGPTAEERCVAVADAGIRACERAPNMPDLQVVFAAQQAAIKAFHTTAGAEVVRREVGRLVEAKDQRKASFGSMGGNPAPVGEPISATDCVNLETLLSDAGVLPADVKAHFGVLRLGALAVSQWEAVVGWVVAEAGKRGIVLQPMTHVPDVEQRPAPSAVDKVRGITERIASERGDMFAAEHAARASGFEGMPDDLPWADEQPR